MHLHRISNTLIINGGYSGNPGLYAGDMGIVLFFYRYALFSQNTIYSKYAFYLLEKTLSKLHQFTPLNYKQGLTGIGSTIEYLAQNGFIEINTDDILKDFDKRIFFTYNLSYLPDDKIADIGYYVLWRMAGNSIQKDLIIKSVLPQIENVMEVFRNYGRPQGCAPTSFDNSELGMYNGLAGLGLSLITELDGDDSWLSLLPNDLYLHKNESLPV